MAESTPAPVPTPTRSRKKAKRSVASGQVHVLASFNNTVVTFTDTNGQVLTSASAGMAGFKGSRKSTAYAAQLASEKAAAKAKEFGLKSVEAYVKGIGLGREAAIR